MRSSGVAGVVASRPVELSACEAEAFRERSGRIVLQPSTVMAELSASEAEAFRERSERIVLQPSTVMAELSASEAEA